MLYIMFLIMVASLMAAFLRLARFSSGSGGNPINPISTRWCPPVM